MILEVVGFVLATSLVTGGAAWIADLGLRRAGRPTRWIWLSALAAPWVLLAAPLLPLPSASPPGVLDGAFVLRLPGLVVDGGGGTPMGGWLTAGMGLLWGVSSVVLTAALMRGHRKLLRDRRRWEERRIAGRRVFLSDDLGPAVAGVTRPWIVLPRWALELPDRSLDLVVLHEEEHVRAGDGLLLAGAFALVLAAPWNPVAWLELRALRRAVELDCDRRVLRRGPDPAAYGQTLLAVAARASGLSLGLSYFAEQGRSLERRILVMTQRRRRWTSALAVTAVSAAVLIGAQACTLDNPIEPSGQEGPQAATSTGGDPGESGAAGVIELPPPPVASEDGERVFEAREIPAEPTFTPFTRAPAIANRDEVVVALRESYPPLLRDAGLGGTAKVWFFIDERGRVLQTRLSESSGHEALDQAALSVAEAFRFQPALNGEVPVPVWVEFPITFQVG